MNEACNPSTEIKLKETRKRSRQKCTQEKKTRKKMIKTDRCTHNSLAWTRENYERNKKLYRKKCKPNKFVDRLPYIRHTT